MSTLNLAIASETTRWQTTAIEESVFGTGDSTEVAEIVDRFCALHLGAAVADCLFYRSSVGCVAGVALTNGQSIVLKAYQGRWPKAFLDDVGVVQEHLARRGFPCAEPLLAATPLSGRENLVIAESLLPDPGMTGLSGPRALVISANGLAHQIHLCRGIGDAPGLLQHPQNSVPGMLYPEPHSPLFDFDGTSDGAEWIDQFANMGSEGRSTDSTPVVIAHTDWSARNVRIADHLVAVYDWDSLAFVTESTAVGQAAATWAVTSEPGGTEFPSAMQIVEYIRQYELASERSFTDHQWRAAGGAATWLLAYIARCEHALAKHGRARPDQHGASDCLKSDGQHLLNLGRRAR
jgi:hypothetical protein